MVSTTRSTTHSSPYCLPWVAEWMDAEVRLAAWNLIKDRDEVKKAINDKWLEWDKAHCVLFCKICPKGVNWTSTTGQKAITLNAVIAHAGSVKHTAAATARAPKPSNALTAAMDASLAAANRTVIALFRVAYQTVQSQQVCCVSSQCPTGSCCVGGAGPGWTESTWGVYATIMHAAVSSSLHLLSHTGRAVGDVVPILGASLAMHSPCAHKRSANNLLLCAPPCQSLASFELSAATHAANGVPGLSAKGELCSNDTARELVLCLSRAIRQQQKEEIKASPVVGVCVDESTDSADCHLLSVYVTYLTALSDVKCGFVRLLPIPGSADAATLYKLLHEGVIKVRTNGAPYRRS